MKRKKEKKSFNRDTVVMREWLAGGFVSTDELVRELELWLANFKEVTK